MSSNTALSTGPRTRSRSRFTLPSDAGDSSADESLPTDVTQMRAQFEKTPGRLPVAMTPNMTTPGMTPARNGKVTAIDPLRDRLEGDDGVVGGKQISPGLIQLRQTPGMNETVEFKIQISSNNKQTSHFWAGSIVRFLLTTHKLGKLALPPVPVPPVISVLVRYQYSALIQGVLSTKDPTVICCQHG